jgi:undecaprenyl-diphosphatase
MHTNAFDAHIIHFINSFSHRSWLLDAGIVLFTSNDLLKGGLLTCLFWWLWARRDNDIARHREILLFGVLACAVSVFFTRIMTLSLPFRIRPLHNPELHFRAPNTMDPAVLANWSSFPSDHMVLYACLATTIWLVNRRIGTIALVYAIVFTGIPRIYAGFHYPTDILTGAAIGIGFAMLALSENLRKATVGPALHWLERRPSSFYAFMFLCTFGIAEAFGSSYLVLRYLVHLVFSSSPN